jgi:ATP-dependent Clp protease ATP-binding subunit ClpA
MSEIGRRICRLAEEAANATQPREALRLLCELRRELEDFERQQTARALGAGESFGAVARSLGISRQAAHRRFRDLAAPGPGDGTERPTPEARLVVQYAHEEAAALGADRPGGEHVLLGILRYGDERVAAALAEAGVTLDGARAAAARLAAGRPSPTAGPLHRRPGRRLVRAALRTARRQRADAVGIEHLLLGALEDDTGGAAALVRAAGASVTAVRALVEEPASGKASAAP